MLVFNWVLRMVGDIKIKYLILGCLQDSWKERAYTWKCSYQYLAKYGRCHVSRAEGKSCRSSALVQPLCAQHDLRLLIRNGIGVEI